jgi:hypothetical protein
MENAIINLWTFGHKLEIFEKLMKIADSDKIP